MRLELISPSLSLEASFMSMVDEFVEAGEREYVYEDVLFDGGFAQYVGWLARGERGELEDLSPWSAYWAVDSTSGTLVGISSLRHQLSPWMSQFGGHIGYRVRPSMRRLGIGTNLLHLTLQLANARGIEKALVVCAPDNVGSQGVLHKNGAVFESEVSSEGRRLLRYWVPTDASLSHPDA